MEIKDDIDAAIEDKFEKLARKMKCDICNEEFMEIEIELSHDIPKWLGGEDKDGRHYLCKKCHKRYESEILEMVLMNFIKELPYHQKEGYKWCAKLVKKYSFGE